MIFNQVEKLASGVNVGTLDVGAGFVNGEHICERVECNATGCDECKRGHTAYKDEASHIWHIAPDSRVLPIEFGAVDWRYKLAEPNVP